MGSLVTMTMARYVHENRRCRFCFLYNDLPGLYGHDVLYHLYTSVSHYYPAPDARISISTKPFIHEGRIVKLTRQPLQNLFTVRYNGRKGSLLFFNVDSTTLEDDFLCRDLRCLVESSSGLA
jgi:hypothetical protein